VFDETKRFVAGFISTKQSECFFIFSVCRAACVQTTCFQFQYTYLQYVALIEMLFEINQGMRTFLKWNAYACVSLSVTGFCLHIMNIIILLLQAQCTNNINMVTQNVHEVLTVMAMNTIIFCYLMRSSLEQCSTSNFRIIM
jgi:hypothetical protein